MDLDEHIGVEDNLERTCATCGATLTEREIEASRETGVFMCTVHASEELPLAEESEVDAEA